MGRLVGARAGVTCVVLAASVLAVVPSGASTGAVPDRPVGLRAVAVSHDLVELAWDDPDDAGITGYEILRRDPAIHARHEFDVIEADTGGAGTAYADSTAQGSTSYLYRVKAHNANGTSEWSRVARVQTPAAPASEDAEASQAPGGDVLGLSVEAATVGMVLRWSAPVGAGEVTGYEIWRDRRGGGDGVLSRLATLGPRWTNYSDDLADVSRYRPVEGLEFRYQVRAVDGSAVVAESEVVTLSYVPAADPAAEAALAPSGLRAVELADSFELSWEPPAVEAGSITSYGVERTDEAADGAPGWMYFGFGSRATTRYDATAKVAGRAYTYRVRASRQHVPSVWSEPITVVWAAPPSDPPRLSRLAVDGAGPVAFDPDAARYAIVADPGADVATIAAGLAGVGDSVEIIALRGDDPFMALYASDADPAAAGHQADLADGGDTLVLIVVTSADGQRQRIYIVLIAPDPGADTRQRALWPDAKGVDGLAPGAWLRSPDDIAPRNGTLPVLDGLTLSGATLDPAFAAGTTSYTAQADADTAVVTVGASAPSGTSFVITPADADPNTAGHQIDLAEPTPGGDPTHTAFAVIARDADGRVNAYLVTVTRAAPASDDAALESLEISGATLAPPFASGTLSYEATVPNSTAEITVDADPVDDGAEAAILPADADLNTDGHQVPVQIGENTVTVTVTAADESTTAVYTVTVTREPADDDATLTSLSIDGIDLSTAFTPDQHTYTAAAAAGTAQVSLHLKPAHPRATVSVVPADTDNGTDGHQITLSAVQPGGEPSTTTIAVVVTAPDGIARQTYVVTVTRAAPPLRAFDLPEGCRIRELTADADGVLRAENWHRPNCFSILEYYQERDDWQTDIPPNRGYARYYAFSLSQRGDVGVTVDRWGSHHTVIRDLDGNQVAYKFHYEFIFGQPFPTWCEQEFGVPCPETHTLEATLDAGAYVVELVQHFSNQLEGSRSRQWEWDVAVSGDHVAAVTMPPLSSLTVDGVAVPSFSPGTHSYELEHAAATVTINAEPATGTSPRTVEILPADADPNTAGHQLEVAPGGLTRATVWVAEVGFPFRTPYRLIFSDDLEASTATIGTVAVDGSVEGRVDSADDRDWFAVDLEAGQRYSIDLMGLWLFGGTLGDPRIFGVRREDGTFVPGSADPYYDYSKNSDVTFRAPTSGRYYIDVGSHDGTNTHSGSFPYLGPFSKGTYLLKVTTTS